MNLLKMLNDSFYEDDDYYWDCKTNNKVKLTGSSTSTNSLNWSCSLSSSLQPDTSTSTFLSLPLKPVQSSSPNSKTQASSAALPHILSESFNSSFSSSSVSPPNSSISSTANRLSTSFSLSSVVSNQSSSLSPDHQKHRQNIIRPVSRKIMTVAPGRSHQTKNNDSSFMCQNHKSNFPPCHKRNNNWLLPPLDTSSAVSREKILVRIFFSSSLLWLVIKLFLIYNLTLKYPHPQGGKIQKMAVLFFLFLKIFLNLVVKIFMFLLPHLF